jgi:hypothetical protein
MAKLQGFGGFGTPKGSLVEAQPPKQHFLGPNRVFRAMKYALRWNGLLCTTVVEKKIKRRLYAKK